MYEPSVVDLIRQTALHALNAAELLVPEWLPDGSRNGREWIACNVARGDRRPGSFGVSLDSGRWNDFADDNAHGGDLVSLLAYLRSCRQVEAAREIDARLSLGLLNGKGTQTKIEQLSRAAETALQTRSEKEQEEQARIERRQKHALHQAVELWNPARRADRLHPYLIAKDVPPLILRQQRQGKLLVPLCMDGRLVNLQIIDAQGNKRFLAGGRVQNCYSPLGKITEGCRLYVCEGWATGATLHIATGSPVVCAMNAGNLKHVALAMRSRYGDSIDLVIAGDDDRQNTSNTGRLAANRAANATGALVIFPEWPTNAPLELSDFNDLHIWRSNQRRETAR